MDGPLFAFIPAADSDSSASRPPVLALFSHYTINSGTCKQGVFHWYAQTPGVSPASDVYCYCVYTGGDECIVPVGLPFHLVPVGDKGLPVYQNGIFYPARNFTFPHSCTVMSLRAGSHVGDCPAAEKEPPLPWMVPPESPDVILPPAISTMPPERMYKRFPAGNVS